MEKILFRVDGYNQIGFGHLYRCLILAENLSENEILFVSNKKYLKGIELIKQNNFRVQSFKTNDDLLCVIHKFQPKIIINDILDTDVQYIKKLKDLGLFVINFEDLGEGAEEADIVINALYEKKFSSNTHYWGEDYYLLRGEFLEKEHKKIKKKVEKILITFGGTDPNNYTLKILKILDILNIENIKIQVILGLGYEKIEMLKSKITNMNLKVNIKQNITNISDYMYEADLIFTSAGRTIYEIASIGTPMIVLAQNERELLHTFAKEKNGIINLGLGYKLSDQFLKDFIFDFMNNSTLRKRCNNLMLKKNLKVGVKNVINLIKKKYEVFNR